MMLFNNKLLQRMIEFKAKVKEIPRGKVTIEHNIFVGQPNYYNPAVAFNIKDNTARRILEYVSANLYTNQTTVELEVKGISKALGVKDDKTIRNAIKILIDNHCMCRWQDIVADYPNVVKPNRNWYLLNPLVVRNINIDNWNEQVNSTIKDINNTAGVVINEFKALEFEEFLDIPTTIDNHNTNPTNKVAFGVKDLTSRSVR